MGNQKAKFHQIGKCENWEYIQVSGRIKPQWRRCPNIGRVRYSDIDRLVEESERRGAENKWILRRKNSKKQVGLSLLPLPFNVSTQGERERERKRKAAERFWCLYIIKWNPVALHCCPWEVGVFLQWQLGKQTPLYLESLALAFLINFLGGYFFSLSNFLDQAYTYTVILNSSIYIESDPNLYVENLAHL